ncbi:MAG: BrnA antitoxin family protein [Lachnospiraceae bacterium]|jgi:uncharacterized protein (DUF4415 family)|nr:BrnA antitoxin family protein [Lachnospiraceae bacterium]
MRKNIDITKEPTQEQITMLTKAMELPVSAEAEYPEFSEADLKQFREISDERKKERQKQNVTLRLSPQALRNAKALGRGYTSVLSRILENVLSNPDKINHYL